MKHHTPLHDRFIALCGSALALCVCLITILVVELARVPAEHVMATLSDQITSQP